MPKALTLGAGTGSLVNHLYSAAVPPVPVVGMGATILCWSDRHACTIVAVENNGKRIGLREDKATRTDSYGMSDCQQYKYETRPGTAEQWFTLRKNGAFVAEGEPLKNGQRCIVGIRDHHYDYSF
jgi:hypothetical protein